MRPISVRRAHAQCYYLGNTASLVVQRRDATTWELAAWRPLRALGGQYEIEQSWYDASGLAGATAPRMQDLLELVWEAHCHEPLTSLLTVTPSLRRTTDGWEGADGFRCQRIPEARSYCWTVSCTHCTTQDRRAIGEPLALTRSRTVERAYIEHARHVELFHEAGDKTPPS
jgi:hypothetical protein